ncbi:aldehyde dehydrogenase family protein [uncultured Pseudoteredinibacter sp.]|uniref:aldehyde dehydrogenase family protein n=1 Tax=uncultured Pseudoteredinibacter sp. TaxID=1641701 RepID=UPI00260B7264|nr:aldehyde dehydrogenase family protein [uncultured Pseudoteredinibacter sp.]
MSKAYQQSEAIKQRLEQVQGHFIAGHWLRENQQATSDVHNPSTGAVISQAICATVVEVDQAVAAARSSFDDERWSGLTPAARAKVLWRIADLMEAEQAELAELEMLDAGKFYASAEQGEVAFAAECFRYFAGWCTKIDGATKQISSGPSNEFHVYSRREPIGVAALIVPWNGPLVQAAWKIAPALAAGCSCVLKPAQETPLSTLKLAEIIQQAGLPDGVLNVVLGDGPQIGGHLAAHYDVDKVSFTGSTVVGKKIIDAAKGNLKKVSLELGGKSPMVVFPDANLQDAAEGAISAIFSNAGQVCVAGSRLYVHKSVYSKLLPLIQEKAEAIKVGSALDPDMDMGPMISMRQLDSVLEKITRAETQGARLLCGGKRVRVSENGGGYFVEPTIFVDVDAGMDIATEEVFGPVLSVFAFDDDDDIVALANDSEYGLAASIWTKDIALAHKTAAKIKAGLLWVNCHGIPDMAVPFGGYKQSGWGRENGYEALLQYTEQKSVIVRL